MAISIKNARKVTVYQDLSRYNCQVGATQLDNGDVVVVFNEMRGRVHLDFDNIALVRSTDNGETWEAETKVTVWPCSYHFGSDCPSVAQLSDGTLLVNFVKTAFVEQKGIIEDRGPQSERLEVMREVDGVWLTKSSDNGYTWETDYKASVAPMRWGQPQDNIVELPNGTLLMAVEGMRRARTYAYQDIEEPFRTYLIRSDNQGLNWEFHSTIAYDPSEMISFMEPALGRTADGNLVCIMRTASQPRFRHQNQWMAYSDDDGESWSQPRPTKMWGYPADLTLLQDGRMLCTYGYRRAPWGVRASVSEDGIHWDPDNEYVVREGGIAPQAAVPDLYWHIGYPTSIQLKDGTIFTVDHQWTQEEPYVQYVVGVLYELEG